MIKIVNFWKYWKQGLRDFTLISISFNDAMRNKSFGFVLFNVGFRIYFE